MYDKRSFAVSFMICVLFASIVSISGCAKKESSIEPEIGTFYVGGESGLSLKFIEGEPPQEFFEDADIPVAVQIENIGEFDIPVGGVNVTISGIPSTAKVTGFRNTVPNRGVLEGIEKIGDSVVPGGFEEIYFGDVNYDLGIPSGSSTPQRMFSRACYLYGANATGSACIRENIYAAASGAQICEVNEEKSVETSAGPIQVANVREFARGPNKISFTVVVENAGPGTVYWRDDGDFTCDDIKPQDTNKLKLTRAEIQGVGDALSNGTCTGLSGTAANIVRLKPDGTGSFVCTWDTTGEDAYESFMNLDFEYMYTAEIIKTVNIFAL